MHPQKLKPDPELKTKPSCSLSVILARDGRSAVVFRRGPSKRVLVLRWWLKDDRIEQGQWFVGRIYDHFCDLSPDGDRLLYYAARHKGELPTWTAISRTPYLTALVLWSCCYVDGGGLFDTSRLVTLSNFVDEQAMLSHGRSRTQISDKELSRHLTVRREPAGDPERSSLESAEHGRLIRDGWTVARAADHPWNEYFKTYRKRSYTKTQVYERRSPVERGLSNPIVLSRRCFATEGETPLVGKHEEYTVRDNTATKRVFSDCTWVDWQMNGDLLFARDGCLYRITERHVRDTVADPLANTKMVADLRSMTFERTAPPQWAKAWT
jgi:hypothetical protein